MTKTIHQCLILEFSEFYELVKHVLNKDVWNIIYKLSLPDLKIGDKCIYYSRNPCNYRTVSIINIYYSNDDNKYSYEFELIDCDCRRHKRHLNLKICKGQRLYGNTTFAIEGVLKKI